jgi:hypothetical protein
MEKIGMMMMNDEFIFIDDCNIYCSNGLKTFISDKDLSEAKLKGMSEDDIKIVAFNYLTRQSVLEDYFTNQKI